MRFVGGFAAYRLLEEDARAFEDVLAVMEAIEDYRQIQEARNPHGSR